MTEPVREPFPLDPNDESLLRLLQGQADFFWKAFVALRTNGISGDYAEFGSHTGGSFQGAFNALAMVGPARHMWAFDSWESLPDDAPRYAHPAWSSAMPGAGGVENFHRACRRNGIPRAAYTTVEGYYEETLPPLGADGAPTDIALAYIDCDLYASTVSVLDFLAPRLKHGMILAFDDWFCWSPSEVSGEQAAVAEFLAVHPEWRFARYQTFHWSGLAFVVERADTLPAP